MEKKKRARTEKAQATQSIIEESDNTDEIQNEDVKPTDDKPKKKLNKAIIISIVVILIIALGVGGHFIYKKCISHDQLSDRSSSIVARTNISLLKDSAPNDSKEDSVSESTIEIIKDFIAATNLEDIVGHKDDKYHFFGTTSGLNAAVPMTKGYYLEIHHNGTAHQDGIIIKNKLAELGFTQYDVLPDNFYTFYYNNDKKISCELPRADDSDYYIVSCAHDSWIDQTYGFDIDLLNSLVLAFKNKEGRSPNDYIELRSGVKSSYLGEYKNINTSLGAFYRSSSETEWHFSQIKYDSYDYASCNSFNTPELIKAFYGTNCKYSPASGTTQIQTVTTGGELGYTLANSVLKGNSNIISTSGLDSVIDSISDIKDSPISPYQNVSMKIKFSNKPDMTAYFYRVSPDSEWQFFKVAESKDISNCSSYNTQDLKNAFAGESCYEEAYVDNKEQQLTPPTTITVEP